MNPSEHSTVVKGCAADAPPLPDWVYEVVAGTGRRFIKMPAGRWWLPEPFNVTHPGLTIDLAGCTLVVPTDHADIVADRQEPTP